MDPITAVGLLASVGQLIELTAKFVEYVNGVRKAPKDRAMLAMEASTLLGLLTNLCFRAQSAAKEQDPWFIGLKSLAGPSGPLDQLKVAMTDLTTKFEPKFGGALVWPFTEKSIKEILTKIERMKSHVVLALHGDQFALEQAIKNDIGDVGINITDVKRDTQMIGTNVSGVARSMQGLQANHDDKHTREVAEWLSPLNFASKHDDAYSRRHEGTGQWLLESNPFRRWFTGMDQHLWCPGIPGAGKTVLASTVVDHLKKTLDRQSTRTVCIYCNHNHHADQTPVNMVASMLKQVIQEGHPVQESLSHLYKRHGLRSTRPSLGEISEIVRQEFGLYKQVFVVLDALDECRDHHGHRSRLLEELQKIPGLKMMITSRPHIDITDHLPDIIWLEVRASDEDLRKYVDGRMSRDKLGKHVKGHKDLQENIRDLVVRNANGMFLLAQLHMDSLVSKNTTKAVRKALETMPTTLDATYDEALKRIQDQTEEDRELAQKVLFWVSYSSRPLRVQELRQALAVEPGEDELDEENMPDEDILTSICEGLVTIDRTSGVVRLVHYTTQEYFERMRGRLFPNAQQDITTTCLDYLNLENFQDPCASDEQLGQRLDEMPLFSYASRYWGSHAADIKSTDIQEKILKFLEQDSKMMSSVQGLSMPEYLYSGYSQKYPKGLSALWLAASLGLADIVEILISRGADIDIKEATQGWTALHRAAENGHADVVRRLLDSHARMDATDATFGRTALYQAASSGHTSVTELLLDYGANIEVQDSEGKTPLHGAAVSGITNVVDLLMSRGANIEARDKADWTPLLRGAANGHLAVVKALVQKGANVEATMRGGWTALAKTAGYGHPSVVSYLITKGANVRTRDKDRSTPLHQSIWHGHADVAIRLIENGAEIEAQDRDGWTPLHDAAWRGKRMLVELLLDKGAKVSAVSVDKWTALHRATFGGQVGTAEVLIQRGADPEARDVYGETALLQASWSGHEKLVRILLDAGAQVDARANDGETALHRAAANGHLDAAAALLEHRANVNAKNKKGETALDQASEYHETEMVKVLDRWKATHQTSISRGGASTPVTPQSTDLVADLDEIKIEEDYDVIDKHEPDEENSSDLDPAVLAALSLNPAVTTVALCGPAGFSTKSRISTIVNGEKRRYFIKTYLKGNETSVFEGEHLSLNAINSVVPSFCPASLAHGKMDSIKGCFMITEFLDRNPLNPPPSGPLSFARKLATLHSSPAPAPEGHEKALFGFPATTICGPTSQPNSYHNCWATFFAENRLRSIQRACEVNQGFDDELNYWILKTIDCVVPALLADGHLGGSDGVTPVVVHGNLWQGNKMSGMIDGRTGIEDVIFDPSASYSHSEFDIGIMRLFGGFPAIFWQEYHRYLPKTEPRSEYEDRVMLYSLYHQLNHHAIYGGSYREESLKAMKTLCEKYATDK